MVLISVFNVKRIRMKNIYTTFVLLFVFAAGLQAQGIDKRGVLRHLLRNSHLFKVHCIAGKDMLMVNLGHVFSLRVMMSATEV